MRNWENNGCSNAIEKYYQTSERSQYPDHGNQINDFTSQQQLLDTNSRGYT